jgi:hypothetical protein
MQRSVKVMPVASGSRVMKAVVAKMGRLSLDIFR